MPRKARKEQEIFGKKVDELKKRRRKIVEEVEEEEEAPEPKGENVRARYSCPLCGMVGDIFINTKPHAVNMAALQKYPHNIGERENFAFTMRHGGFRYDHKRKKFVGIISKLSPVPAADIPLLKILLANVDDLRFHLLDKLLELKADLPDDIDEAMQQLIMPRLWDELNWVIGRVDK